MENLNSNSMAPATVYVNAAPADESKAKRAKRTVNPFWVTINRSRKVFDMQLDKSNEVKLRCLGHQLGRERDPQKFYLEFMEQVDWLLDSRRFTEQCKAREIEPRTLATHVVFLGSATMHKVRENGIYDRSISGDLELYKESFLPDDPQKFVAEIA